MDVDWKIWCDVSQTELWRAVALSLGYDPFDLPGYHQQIEHAPFDNCPAEFQRRLFIARSHLGSGLKANVRPDKPLWCAHVELAVLHQWANTLKNPWDFPEEFPHYNHEIHSDKVEVSAGGNPNKQEVKRQVLISQMRPRWASIERDLNNASRNGLRVAKVGNGMWDVSEAIKWGESRGKIKEVQALKAHGDFFPTRNYHM